MRAHVALKATPGACQKVHKKRVCGQLSDQAHGLSYVRQTGPENRAEICLPQLEASSPQLSQSTERTTDSAQVH